MGCGLRGVRGVLVLRGSGGVIEEAMEHVCDSIQVAVGMMHAIAGTYAPVG